MSLSTNIHKRFLKFHAMFCTIRRNFKHVKTIALWNFFETSKNFHFLQNIAGFRLYSSKLHRIRGNSKKKNKNNFLFCAWYRGMAQIKIGFIPVCLLLDYRESTHVPILFVVVFFQSWHCFVPSCLLLCTCVFSSKCLAVIAETNQENGLKKDKSTKKSERKGLQCLGRWRRMADYECCLGLTLLQKNIHLISFLKANVTDKVTI